MPEVQQVEPGARIGPNALTQFQTVLENAGETALWTDLLQKAQITTLPDMTGLIPEQPVARFHRHLRAERPNEAAHLSRQAGRRTADYILAHRIPKTAQWLLKMLPASASARLLAKAIAKNAWTFAGSGRFEILSFQPLRFALYDNPLILGETAKKPLCDWNAAVFERLFQELVNPAAEVRETTCRACGADACRFDIDW
ncbi:bacteriochlorophyll synthase 23 kDa chain [Roseibium aquae]|uniref:Bacteriochlorophyll synthase 23 kDa chain n=1 Tax=Roseibium aquae TaxID=1323746 RepID=A0A916WUL9_9HYPH|nr:bacteriochlorophyll 4-vinyl reductase [Roseibium aquae]GGB33990.1 bacteriochlorophyll synthase 23 kDa chain [Roseibium aquae]